MVYLGLTFGWRTWSQYRSAGDTGFRLGRGAPSVERAAVALAVAGGVTGMVGTVCAKSPGRRASPARVAALAGMAAGMVGTYSAQRDMGESWRVGVDARESVSLITSGLFRYVRNPVFSFMTLVWVSSAVAVPNAATAAGAAMLATGLDFEVRLVEEPYLREVHGEPYLAYARASGRAVGPRPGHESRPRSVAIVSPARPGIRCNDLYSECPSRIGCRRARGDRLGHPASRTPRARAASDAAPAIAPQVASPARDLDRWCR